MSRDAFGHDPRGGPGTADRPDRKGGRRPNSIPSQYPYNGISSLEVPGSGQAPDVPEVRTVREERGGVPRAYYLRDRAYLLRDSQMHSLREIGKFRVISVSDLGTYGYRGSRERIEKDIRGLARQSLLQDRTLEISRKRTLRVVTLTKVGHRLLTQSDQLPEDQPIYHDLANLRDVEHDADLYRLYQKEAARIERDGGRPVRVLLDYELKRNLNRDLARLGADKDDPNRKAAVARKHQLLVVDGRIPVPDLRVEYESPELELRHVDLELATRNYHSRAVVQKASAGFALYGRSEDASRLRRVLGEREITARIRTL
jgi:hypothetical protein